MQYLTLSFKKMITTQRIISFWSMKYEYDLRYKTKKFYRLL